jgi:hypothetical protein
MAARLIALALAGASLLAQQSDEQTFKKICGNCHDVSLVSDFKSTPEWNETVDSMIERGAKATPDERAAVMRYLARNFTLVNINAASADDIAAVLELDKSDAQKLIDHRPYTSFADILKVPGVPAAKLESHKTRIVFR